jgi:CRISPR-associated protein Cas5d
VILRDVDYLVDFHFDIIPEKMGKEDDPKKFYNILLRRLRKGQHHSQPYLGCREFPAWVSILEEGEPRPQGAYQDNPEMDLDLMLYDVDYRQNCAPILFHAVMRHGEIVPEVSA